ncbi:MAG: Crp/Fnr family transcriptional regulator [Bacteroidota bacterium]
MITTNDLLSSRFETFEPVLLDEISKIGEVREVEPNTVVLRYGDPIRTTTLVLDGRLKVYREDDEGNEFLIYYVDAGSACAMSIMCAAMNEESKITVVTDTDTTLLSVPLEKNAKWLREFRSWDEFILGTYRKRFDELLNVLDNVAFRNMDQRIAHYLVRRSQGEGEQLKVSHQEIARDLNTAREVISRLLKKLEQNGILELSRSTIKIIDIKALKQV